jgi:hypothetical protein
MSNIIREWNGYAIEQRPSGFINGTAMCAAHNKKINDWVGNEETLDLLEALAADLGLLPNGNLSRNLSAVRVSEVYPDLIVSRRGSPELGGGTWVHPDLAVPLAQWCSPKFALQVSRWTQELLTTGRVELAAQSQAPRFYQRLVLFNQRTGKIPTGYFCVFSETLELVGQLEAHGYTIPDHLTMDISIGSCWCNYMRKTLELEPRLVCRKYDHWYPGQPYPVKAYIYPLQLLPEFREWFDITYCRNQLLHYLKRNDPSALPAVNRFLGLLLAVED